MDRGIEEGSVACWCGPLPYLKSDDKKQDECHFVPLTCTVPLNPFSSPPALIEIGVPRRREEGRIGGSREEGKVNMCNARAAKVFDTIY